jgi:predicted nucleic acid-binding Zn ribbon protein
MIPDSLRCSLAGCDEPRTTRRDHALGQFCDMHRYYQPVQHAPRTCPGCGSEFVPRRSDQTHCSKRCRNRLSARRTYTPRPRSPQRRPLVCEACGVTYLAVWGRYCSARCTNKAWKERRRDDYLAGKRRHRERMVRGA